MRAAAMLALLLTGCGYDWTVVPKPDASTPSDASAPSEASAPIPCAGKAACPADSFCAFPDRLCAKGMPGTCRKSPPTAECDDAGFQPLCDCDGFVVDNECKANAKGADVSGPDACKPQPGKDRCGYLFCDAGTNCVMAVLDGGLVEYRCGP